MKTEAQIERELRKRLLNWHYKKAQTVAILDLLESDYQSFRRRVCHRTGNHDLDFREAIKQANMNELEFLDIQRTEKRLGI